MLVLLTTYCIVSSFNTIIVFLKWILLKITGGKIKIKNTGRTRI